MSKTYCITDKVLFNPRPEEREYFLNSFGCSRFIYNTFVSMFKEKNLKNSTNFFSLDMFVTQKLGVQYPFLKEKCCSTTRKNTSREFSIVAKNFFNRRKKHKKCNLKFKKKYDEIQSCSVGVKKLTDDNKIILSKMSKPLKTRGMRQINGKLVVAKVKWNQKLDRWYLCLTYKCQKISRKKDVNKSVGIDLGLSEFYISSDGEAIENPKFYRSLEKKLAKEQRKLSKKQGYRKGEKKSKNFKKQQLKVQKIHDKIVNSRKDFLHKTSRNLVNNYDYIFAENLSVAGMARNHKLSKSINDSSWSTFDNMLSYKCDFEDKVFLKIDRFFPSTQICSNCGEKAGPKGEENLDVREWNCPKCGASHNRDLNAAANILNKGLSAVGHTVKACRERVRLNEGSPSAAAKAKLCSMKQESC